MQSLTAHRVSGKAVHDYAEIFDGVPSQHDGKDAAMVAELAAIGKSSPWPYEPLTEFDQELRDWWRRNAWTSSNGSGCCGWDAWKLAVGAALARGDTVPGVEFRNLVTGLVENGGPAALAADAKAAKRLKGWAVRS